MKDLHNDIPASAKDAEELVDFIKNETPEDEYLRVRRDMHREIMYVKNTIAQLMEDIKKEIDHIDWSVLQMEESYENYLKQKNGSS